MAAEPMNCNLSVIFMHALQSAEFLDDELQPDWLGGATLRFPDLPPHHGGREREREREREGERERERGRERTRKSLSLFCGWEGFILKNSKAE